MAEPVTFAGYHGDELSGRWHEPPERCRGTLVLAHCFTCSKDLSIVTRLAERLTEAGFAVLRFDFTGLGDSEGDFERSTFAANVGDLVRAAVFAVERRPAPLGLIGHSLGGAAVLAAAPAIKAAKAVAVIGAPARPKHVSHLLTDDVRHQAVVEGCAYASIAGRTFPISKQFLADLERFDRDPTYLPTMVLHAPDDTVVEVSEGERIFAAAPQPKAFLPLIGGDHLLTDPNLVAFAAQRLASWFGALL